MGWIDIPDQVSGRGVVVTGELDRQELQELLRRLNGAVEAITSRAVQARPLAKQETTSSPLTAQPGPDGSHPVSTVQAPRKPAAKPIQPFDPQKMLLDKLAAGTKKAAQPYRSAVPAQAVNPKGTAIKWKETHRTDAEEHRNDAVHAMAYAPILDGLPGGDGHGGWLVSSSKNVLNLWECSAGCGEPALQLMHSQMTDFQMTDLKVERDTQLLMAASRETSGTHAECVSLHSLSANAGMFAPRSRLPLPPKILADPVVRDNPPEKAFALQLESLHSFSGPLKSCVAASFKSYITVYATTQGAGAVASPKTTWQAHESFITQLHRSSYSIDLFSAAVDGTVRRWDLRAKPKQAAAKFVGITREVTGMQQISDSQLLAGSEEGLLAIWDLRHCDKPLCLVMAPDGSGVAKVSASPEEGLAAFATASGNIFSMDLTDLACTTASVSSTKLHPPIRSLTWNQRTHQLLVASGCSIFVFSRAK